MRKNISAGNATILPDDFAVPGPTQPRQRWQLGEHRPRTRRSLLMTIVMLFVRPIFKVAMTGAVTTLLVAGLGWWLFPTVLLSLVAGISGLGDGLDVSQWEQWAKELLEDAFHRTAATESVATFLKSLGGGS
jgi:DNA-binding transcriptional LysR family regulator